MDIRYGGHATRERAAIVSKIVVKSFERKQATVDKPPLLLDRNERSFRLGILMHRLSLLHSSSSPPPPPFPRFTSVDPTRLSRDFFAGFRFAFPFLASRMAVPSPLLPIQIRGRAALISRLKELGPPLFPQTSTSLLAFSSSSSSSSSSFSSFRKLLPSLAEEKSREPISPTSTDHF